MLFQRVYTVIILMKLEIVPPQKPFAFETITRFNKFVDGGIK